jgi:hypothetical protein
MLTHTSLLNTCFTAHFCCLPRTNVEERDKCTISPERIHIRRDDEFRVVKLL